MSEPFSMLLFPSHSRTHCTMYATPLSMHFTAPLPLQSGASLRDYHLCVGSDSMINDAYDAPIVHRLPAWYRKGLNAPTFLLLPLQIKGSAFGLIYADKKQKGALELDEKELGLLRTLRNQALMAFKQSS